MSLDHAGFSDFASLGGSSDHALVVHVWHLDVLDDLVEAAANLPESTDQFVTIPITFDEAQRDRVATAFPRARLVPVEKLGQDVGPLFQLMREVDLGRYDFICKIHTKKGVSPMQVEWRRALLDGVLGSKRQVQHIIDGFRADTQVMLAGARQLYLHGPSYLDPNAEAVAETFGDMLGDFDLRTEDWGFVAGTCFWVRTAILQDMAARHVDFRSEAHVTEVIPAHAAECLPGLAVAIRGGKLLLQDLRFSERLPDEERGFPNDLPRKPMRIEQILTPLAANLFIRPRPVRVDANALAKVAGARRRVAVFASYSSDGLLPPQVIPYLEGLKPLTTAIVVACDNDLLPSEREKLSGLAAHVITGRHGEYDFGSYKRGIVWAREAGLLDHADDLILCNDSCYGPVRSFAPMFATMDAKGLDFWGATDSHQISYHLQSYFLVLSRTVFLSNTFISFISGITKQDTVQNVIIKYEVGLTSALISAGFSSGALIENHLAGVHPKDQTYGNIPVAPFLTIAWGSPFLKIKAMKYPHTNMDGPNRVLSWLKNYDPKLYAVVTSDFDVARLAEADDVAFSLILPTRNRAYCIGRTIRSVLSQSHKNFELIIIDDGSDDNTKEVIHNEFSDALARGQIRYISLMKNVGVCAARNIGLANARNPWIGYVDSDNEVRPYMLTMFAASIVRHRTVNSFYAKIFNINSGVEIGAPFNRKNLEQANFIDLGVFIHKKKLFAKYGGFDENLKRLVDWDLIVRYTKERDAFFIPRVCLDYQDDQKASDRISVRESFVKALTAIRSKHSHKPTVSTVVLSYNHEQFIVDAIESALEQRGEFHHEILLADDGSTDGTARIMARYVEKYPLRVRNITRKGNFGVSENYRHCFREAEGHFIAILEGDDYWTDPEKNLKQATFLQENREAAMVHSRIELFAMQSNSRRLLKRQQGLPSMLSAADFARNEHLNLIVNLSSCMFRSDLMKQLPNTLYEPRLSEIALAFYFDRIGKIGFLPQVMSTYRLNEKSVWTGADRASQHQQAIDVRQCALRVARPIYRATIQKHIDQRQGQMAAELTTAAA